MASEAATVRDLLPIPDNIDAITNPQKTEAASALEDRPTASHALAVGDHDEKGRAQEGHDDEVKDLGWNEPKDKIASPLVGGMHNEDLWILIRRFNKVSGPKSKRLLDPWCSLPT